MPRCLLQAVVAASLLRPWAGLAEMAAKDRGSIPFDLLAEGERDKVRGVTEHRTLFRVLDAVEFTGTARIYTFLLERLPLAADAVRALGIQEYRVRDNGDGTFEAEDGAGASGTFSLAFSQPGKRIYYAVGRYDGDLIRIRGQAVVVVEYEEVIEARMRNWVHLYFKFDSLILGTIVKSISPLIGPLVDRKISYFLGATRELCRRITTDPARVYESLSRMADGPASSLEEFRKAFLAQAAVAPAAGARSEAPVAETKKDP
ncbi:MAG: hypothetical protein HYU36_06835 [Planctomycetes bacterium]|nr:hypothetical protein [Planctomycetota bacterium]